MCISNNSYEAPVVNFDDTILLAHECQPVNGQAQHLCGYFNKVQVERTQGAGADFGWAVSKPTDPTDFGWDIAPPAKKKGNAMLIAVPAVPGSVNEKSLVPVGKYPKFMEDYKRAIVPPAPKMASRGMSFGIGAGDDAPIVVKGFDGGTYDVVIARDDKQIASVIGEVDEDKRPDINQDLYRQLGLVYPYPNFTFVLFCFSESDSAQAGCALVKYTPQLPHLLFLPGLDGHNGKIEVGEVEVNHTLVASSYRLKAGFAGIYPVSFSDPGVTEALPFLPKLVLGKVLPKGMRVPQGDFLFLTDEVAAGKFRCKRALPPGWNRLFGAQGVPANPYYING